jgi:uncharacterized iron-regulated protein
MKDFGFSDDLRNEKLSKKVLAPCQMISNSLSEVILNSLRDGYRRGFSSSSAVARLMTASAAAAAATAAARIAIVVVQMHADISEGKCYVILVRDQT